MHKTLFVPVLYGEGQTQVLLVEDICLPEHASKIVDVRVETRNLQGHICKGKVIFQGILHKQLFFVNRHNLVQHHQTEHPFSGFVEVPCASPGMKLRFLEALVEKDCSREQLVTPSELHEKHIVTIRVAVFREEKVWLEHHC